MGFVFFKRVRVSVFERCNETPENKEQRYIKKKLAIKFILNTNGCFFLFWFRTSTNWKKTVERFFITAGLAVALVSFIVNKIN